MLKHKLFLASLLVFASCTPSRTQQAPTAPISSVPPSNTPPLIILPPTVSASPSLVTTQPSGTPKPSLKLPVMLSLSPSRFVFRSAGEVIRLNVVGMDEENQVHVLPNADLVWHLENPNAFTMPAPGVIQSQNTQGISHITVYHPASGLSASGELVAQYGSDRDSSSGSGSSGSSRPRSLSLCIEAQSCRLRPAIGAGMAGSQGDSGTALAAGLNDPHGLVADDSGTLYIADSLNHKIRRVNSENRIFTFAGIGLAGISEDQGQALLMSLNFPHSLALDSAGNVYVSDKANNRIRKINPGSGEMVTVAGGGNGGDGSLATDALLSFPLGIAFDTSGNLLIADSLHNTIRKVDTLTKRISTVVGTGSFGSEGDGGLATQATLNFPHDLAVDSNNNLYIADALNHKIRKVNLVTGTISTIAGNGTVGYQGDGGPATAAALNGPRGIAITPEGNLFIADTYNKVIRMVDGRSGIITTVAGGGRDTSGSALSVKLEMPYDVVFTPSQRLYVIDALANKVFELSP